MMSDKHKNRDTLYINMGMLIYISNKCNFRLLKIVRYYQIFFKHLYIATHIKAYSDSTATVTLREKNRYPVKR